MEDGATRTIEVLRIDAQPTASAAAEVRDGLRGAIAESPFAARLDDVLLATTELVTNAVLHGRSPITVSLSLGPESLRVAVQDGSAVSPTFSYLDPTAMTGRGLMIVAALAERWGVEPVEGGKCVWIEVDREPASAEVEADIDALLASWGDTLAIDPALESVRVVATDMSTRLLLEAETHTEGVLRELALHLSGGTPVDEVAREAEGILAAAEAFDAPRAEVARQLAVAGAAGLPTLDVELRFDRQDAEAVRDFSHAVDSADRLCRAGHLLHAPLAPPAKDALQDLLRRVLVQLGS